MARDAYIFATILLMTLVLVPAARLETAIEHSSPFRMTGDGVVKLIDVQTGERLSIIYRDSDGNYDDSTLEAIDHTLRCHGKKVEYPISLKLVELIDHLQDHFGAPEVEIVSGYRSPEYNAWLKTKLRRVAHDSLHMQGLAMDVRLPNVGKGKLGEFARSLRTGGVGIYGNSNFVHIDVGPVRKW